MQLLSFRKPYEMLPPVPEKQMLPHGFAYHHGTCLKDIGVLVCVWLYRCTYGLLHIRLAEEIATLALLSGAAWILAAAGVVQKTRMGTRSTKRKVKGVVRKRFALLKNSGPPPMIRSKGMPVPRYNPEPQMNHPSGAAVGMRYTVTSAGVGLWLGI